MRAAELIANVAAWAQRDERVVAAGICGSYARGDAGPDSDIDFCIVCDDPGSLLDDRSWIDGLGPGARVAGPVEDYSLVQSIRVCYGTTEAEFGVTDQAWMELPIDPGTARVMNDGLQILYDPAGRLAKAVAFAASMLD